MCSGDNQLLADGRMMPKSSMCSNSCRAILTRSGLAHEWTGGPVVVIWCVTSCLMEWLLLQGCITAGNSHKIASNPVLGKEEGGRDWVMSCAP